MDDSHQNWAIMVTWHQHFIIMYDFENIKKNFQNLKDRK